MTEWNKDLEKKILRKSSYALTFRVIRVMLALFIDICCMEYSFKYYGGPFTPWRKKYLLYETRN